MARRNSAGIRWEYDTLTPRTKLFALKFNGYMAAEVEKWAILIEEAAQRDAPWEDRTGDARAGLTATGKARGFYHEIELHHTVPYGIWLEVKFNGRDAIILPTIEKYGPAVMADLSIEGGISGPRAA